jgi:CheY-like chemotaxis protein
VALARARLSSGYSFWAVRAIAFFSYAKLSKDAEYRRNTLRVRAGHNAVGGNFCDDLDVRPTVLIVDDHDSFRESARALLEAEGFAVVGDAADGVAAVAAVAAVARLRPDMVLLDIQLPDVDGFVVAERLAAGPDPPRIVLISSRDSSTYGVRVGAAPVCGFLAKRELSGAALAALVR